MSKFFINRPIFAWVLAIIVMISGGIAILVLPVEQYPDVAPTAVQIRVSYPGADATTLQNSVTQVIEQNMTGLDGLMYMSSTSDSSGTLQLTLSFKTASIRISHRFRFRISSRSPPPFCHRKCSNRGLR